MMSGHKAHNTCLIVRPDAPSDSPPAWDGPRLKLAHDQALEDHQGLSDQERTLLTSLTRRGLELDVVQGGPGAMLALARQSANLLIVIAPASQSRLAELLEAVRRYYPHTACWGYHLETDHLSKAQPRLERLDKPESPEDQVEAQAKDQNVETSDSSDDPSDQQPLVSEQELAMLLGE